MSPSNKRDLGVFRKFAVTRTDGGSAPGRKHAGCEYFVLDLVHDPHAIPAVRAYTVSAKMDGYHQLAWDLRQRIGDIPTDLNNLRQPVPREVVERPDPQGNAIVLARLLHDLSSELDDRGRAEWLIAQGVTVGSASPVRPPTSFDTAIRDVENCLRYVVPRDSDKENFEQLRQAVARLQASVPVRDPAPPDEPEHPEAFCQQCRRRNVVWFAPSDIWNATMGGGQGILCPVCFIEAAERAGLFGPWIVAPGHSVQKRSGGERVRGVRDPSPPEPSEEATSAAYRKISRALAAFDWTIGPSGRPTGTAFVKQEDYDALLAGIDELRRGVRGAGVVPPEPKT